MDWDFSSIFDNWVFLAKGVGDTFLLSLLGIVLSMLLGLILSLLRLYGPGWLSRVVAFYIDSMRALPILVVLVWTYFAFPIVSSITLAPFWAALVALTLHTAAYAAEVFRAGIESVRAGQTRVGKALGMSKTQVLRKIILPQATIRMLPAIGSVLTIVIKDTAICSMIAVPDLMYRSEVVAGQSYRPVEVYTVALLIYFVILFPVTRIVDMAYKKYSHLGRS